MSRSIKLKNNDYLDSSGVTHNRTKLKDILDSTNSGLTNVSASALAVTTTNSELTLLETTIPNAGVYLLLADIPINYYGATGRDLFIRIKVNNSIVHQNDGVINGSVFTLNRHLFKMLTLSANSNIKITIQSANSQQFACGGFDLQYLRLK